MHFSNLFFVNYWLSSPEPAVGFVQQLWLGILVGPIAIGLVVLFLKRRVLDRGVVLFAGRLSNCLVVLGVTGLLFFLFRQERVVLLGWRVWFIPWFVIGLIWLSRLGYYWFKRVPIIRSEQQSRAEREQFFSKRKK